MWLTSFRLVTWPFNYSNDVALFKASGRRNYVKKCAANVFSPARLGVRQFGKTCRGIGYMSFLFLFFVDHLKAGIDYLEQNSFDDSMFYLIQIIAENIQWLSHADIIFTFTDFSQLTTERRNYNNIFYTKIRTFKLIVSLFIHLRIYMIILFIFIWNLFTRNHLSF